MSRAPVTARELALDALVRVEQEGAYSNLALGELLGGRARGRLSAGDAALATELVYGTIQRLNTLDYYISRLYAKGLDKLQPWVRCLLRLSLYQLVYLDRIPAHAAVNEAVSIAGRRGHRGVSGLVNAILRGALRRPESLALPDDAPPLRKLALAHSHPEWLIERWAAQLGNETAERICEANNEPPQTSVRVNRLKATREELIARLDEHGWRAEPSAVAPDGVVVHGGGYLAGSQPFASGLCTIQDESSMLVAELLDPQPGMMTLDCCAAPGGKTTHIAEKQADEGTVYAFDLHPHKRKLIEEAARRLGLRSVRAETGDAAKLPERFAPASFDRVLLDAPCSGFGVIRRKPDLKWSKRPGDIAEISRLQARLLRSASGLVKPGGILVYSTCTLEREENEDQIRAFLAEHPDYALDATAADRLPHLKERFIEPGMLRILPHHYGTDGFFIAALRRKQLIHS